jgi:hypothetical protein
MGNNQDPGSGIRDKHPGSPHCSNASLLEIEIFLKKYRLSLHLVEMDADPAPDPNRKALDREKWYRIHISAFSFFFIL